MLRAFDDGRLFGVTHGPEPARVLALPGWLHTVADYDRVLGDLADGSPDGSPVGSIALDLPGFGGATPEPDVGSGAAGYAKVVAPVLLSEFDQPAVVVGHSFGGRVALHLAADHPGRVRALVLTGVPNLFTREGPAKAPPLGFRIGRALHRRGLVSDERMEAMRRRSGSADYRNAPSGTMRNVLVAVTNENYEEQLARIECPIELVWGESDDQAPVASARRAVEVLGDRATLTVLPGIGHFVPTLAPDAIAAAIARRLR